MLRGGKTGASGVTELEGSQPPTRGSDAGMEGPAPGPDGPDPLDRPATDVDVLHCYHLLLGREPENGFVLREAGRHALRAVLGGFLDSAEFRTRVLPPLSRGEPTPQEEGPILPTAQHRAWVGAVLRLPPARRAALEGAGWPELLRAVLSGLGRALPGQDEAVGVTLARVEEKLRLLRRRLAEREMSR